MRMNLFAALMLTTALTPAICFDSIKTSYTDEADIPTSYKGLYTETDGVWVLSGVEGLKTQKDVESIQGALRKERNDHKILRETLRSKFGEQYNLDELAERVGKVEELEAQIAAGDFKDPKKLDALVDARAKARSAPMEREIAELRKKNGELATTNDGLTQQSRTRSIHDAVREAAAKAKVLPEALDDAMILAERAFIVDEDGTVVTNETRMSASDWFADLQPKKTHWWPSSQGGGAGGNNGGGNGKNPWSAEHWNMTEQSVQYKANPTRAATLAQAAGTKIGGARPAKKS